MAREPVRPRKRRRVYTARGVDCRLSKDNLKARLAYSTISQLSYIVLAAALATGASIIGGSMHIAMHAFGKITLFFCAGAIYTAHHLTKVSELDGIGRKMPITMAAFLIGFLASSDYHRWEAHGVSGT